MKTFCKTIRGWGGFPAVKAKVLEPETVAEVQEAVVVHPEILAHGGGNSYGDSSLNTTVIRTAKLTRIIAEAPDWIEAEAGATLGQLLRHLLPRRRFLTVLPGTQAVTVGGAIASDVHGKNHATAGSFFNITQSLLLVNEKGALMRCSRQENAALFYKCFGGMGLQGIIVSAVLSTVPLPSYFITERQFVADSLSELFRLMEQHSQASYLIGWLDLLARDFRGIIKTGEWNRADRSIPQPQNSLALPFRFPVAPPRFLFRWYNSRYFQKARQQPVRSVAWYRFFHPLDGLRNWRYAFGRRGLLQYHFRLPLPTSEQGIGQVIEMVRNAHAVCTLAVLKRFGKGNPETPDSFAQEGYNLALDFIHTPAAVALIHQLDETVAACGGQIYKTKDAVSRLPQAIKSSHFQSIQNQRYAGF